MAKGYHTNLLYVCCLYKCWYLSRLSHPLTVWMSHGNHHGWIWTYWEKETEWKRKKTWIKDFIVVQDVWNHDENSVNGQIVSLNHHQEIIMTTKLNVILQTTSKKYFWRMRTNNENKIIYWFLTRRRLDTACRNRL